MIRAYTSSDAARCCEIINHCLPQLTDMNQAARNWVRTKNVPSILHAELDNFFTVVLAESDCVVGLGSLADAEIKRVYVDPAHQLRGAGSAIGAALENEATRSGLRTVHVKSRPDAVSFYDRLGYRECDRQLFVIDRSEFTIVNMEKSL